jgi:hypothetical protein
MIYFGVSTGLSAGRSATSKTSSQVQTGWNRSDFRASAKSKLRAPVVAIPSVDLHAAHDLVIRDARVSAERRHSTAGGQLKGARHARLLLVLKASNCDDFLGHRACQLQWLVLRPAEGSSLGGAAVRGLDGSLTTNYIIPIREKKYIAFLGGCMFPNDSE